MSTIEATVSMLENMTEDARIRVLEFTKNLYISPEQENPFVPLTEEQILADLAESRQQIEGGHVRPMEDVLDELEHKYGFV